MGCQVWDETQTSLACSATHNYVVLWRGPACWCGRYHQNCNASVLHQGSPNSWPHILQPRSPMLFQLVSPLASPPPLPTMLSCNVCHRQCHRLRPPLPVHNWTNAIMWTVHVAGSVLFYPPWTARMGSSCACRPTSIFLRLRLCGRPLKNTKLAFHRVHLGWLTNMVLRMSFYMYCATQVVLHELFHSRCSTLCALHSSSYILCYIEQVLHNCQL